MKACGEKDKTMKIKEGFILRTVVGEHVVVAVGKASMLLNGIIKLNESGTLLWDAIKDEADKEQLAALLVRTYGIPEKTAEKDVNSFLETLRGAGCLEE